MHMREVAIWTANPLAVAWLRLWLLMLAIFSLNGCAIQLAPDYDAQLLDGLTAANKEALVLFAKVDNGSPREDFDKLADDYAETLAAFEALQQRANARQNPPLALRLAKMKFISSFCQAEADPNSCLNATGSSLTETVDTLRRMRAMHRDRGLLPEAVTQFRGRYDIQIHQALTVETALKR